MILDDDDTLMSMCHDTLCIIDNECVMYHVSCIIYHFLSSSFLSSYPLSSNSSYRSLINLAIAPPTIEPMNARLHLRSGRLLLTHLGLLSPHSRDRVLPLPLTDALLSRLEQLDATSERVCISLPVLYAESSSASMSALLEGGASASTPLRVTEDYMDFMRSLGWLVDVGTHVGFRGVLDGVRCPTAPYYCDLANEMIVVSPAFMTENIRVMGNMGGGKRKGSKALMAVGSVNKEGEEAKVESTLREKWGKREGVGSVVGVFGCFWCILDAF